jgi:hypothetical protein
LSTIFFPILQNKKENPGRGEPFLFSLEDTRRMEGEKDDESSDVEGKGGSNSQKCAAFIRFGKTRKKRETQESKRKTGKTTGDSGILSHDFGKKKESLKFQGKGFEKKRNP